MDYTLVIPTYNRPALLRRLVQHYYNRSRWMKLLVLDSSKPDVTAENARALTFAGKSVRHVTFPETISTVSKLSSGLDVVETPYVSLSADDDLVFPSGVLEAIAFLKEHPDYICAHGLYLNFRQDGCDVHLAREYAGPSIEAVHPGARIFRLLQKYESLYYAAFRTSDLREVFSAARALPTLVFQELFQSIAALIKGKVRRFPALYAARQSCPPAQPERDKWQTHYWFAKDPAEVIAHYRVYCAELWGYYEARGPAPRLDKVAFFKTLDLAHAVYFSAGCPPEYFYSMLQAYWPEDRYLPAGERDLFDELTPVGASTRAAHRLLGTLWSRWQNMSLAYGLSRLNREAREACHAAWKCHLPVRLHWLAGVPDFRRNWLELCAYLDQ